MLNFAWLLHVGLFVSFLAQSGAAAEDVARFDSFSAVCFQR